MGKTVIISENKCKGCYLCVDACPRDVLGISPGSLNELGYSAAGVKNGDDCAGCIGCALMCPDGAISVMES